MKKAFKIEGFNERIMNNFFQIIRNYTINIDI